MKDLSRNVRLLCPVCGNDQFSTVGRDIEDLLDAPGDTQFPCSDCRAIYTKEELIEENQGVIYANIEEIKSEAVKEFEKELKKALKKLR